MSTRPLNKDLGVSFNVCIGIHRDDYPSDDVTVITPADLKVITNLEEQGQLRHSPTPVAGDFFVTGSIENHDSTNSLFVLLRTPDGVEAYENWYELLALRSVELEDLLRATGQSAASVIALRGGGADDSPPVATVRGQVIFGVGRA